MAWACSGPDTWRFIVQANEFANTRAGIASAIMGISTVLWAFARRRLWLYPALCVLAVALHPSWSISALRGDCGAWKMEAATRVTATAAGVLGVQFVHVAWAYRQARWRV